MTPSISELELAAKNIVWNAKKEGNLKSVFLPFEIISFFHFENREFTPRLVRSTLEEQFHLDEGTLGTSEYKSAINAATKAALVCGIRHFYRLLNLTFFFGIIEGRSACTRGGGEPASRKTITIWLEEETQVRWDL
jgi:hypothetical protein